MFGYFYNEILRRTIISFGTLFNNVTIQQDNSVVKVPLAYGPTQKFLARLEQQPNLNKPVQISLPRMSFEFSGVSYDSDRKLAGTQAFTTALKSDKREIRKMYHPVPYNMSFELSIFIKDACSFLISSNLRAVSASIIKSLSFNGILSDFFIDIPYSLA